jgi:uncharacterized protein YidB (DUF937 family)
MSEFMALWTGLAELVGAAEGAGGGIWPGLLAQLESAGLGEQVKSWLGEGDNLPVTADQLSTAFTPQQIQAWAEQAGTTPDVLLERLAEALPHAVSPPE